MKLITNVLANIQRADRPKPVVTDGADTRRPRIAAIYGFMAREHMQRHLLNYVRKAGYADTTLYGHLQSDLIANDLQAAARQGRPIVLLGYSQGGLEAIRVAHLLAQRGVRVDLVVTIAAGGMGRWFPHRWADNPRRIPSNVGRCINYFAVGDVLGSDRRFDKNLAAAQQEGPHVENISFPASEGINHLSLVKCYPEHKVHPRVKTELLDRLRTELAALA